MEETYEAMLTDEKRIQDSSLKDLLSHPELVKKDIITFYLKLRYADRTLEVRLNPKEDEIKITATPEDQSSVVKAYNDILAWAEGISLPVWTKWWKSSRWLLVWAWLLYLIPYKLLFGFSSDISKTPVYQAAEKVLSEGIKPDEIGTALEILIKLNLPVSQETLKNPKLSLIIFIGISCIVIIWFFPVKGLITFDMNSKVKRKRENWYKFVRYGVPSFVILQIVSPLILKLFSS